MARGWKPLVMKKIIALSLISVLSVASFAAAARNISGTWRVTNNPSMKLVFTPQGAFKFVGANYSSSGTYKLDGDTIKLSWTKVDGQAVKPGSMHRNVTMNADNTFNIDRYTYAR